MHPHTEAVRKNVQAYTGAELVSCPWRAFSVPIVRETLSAIQFEENGNLAFGVPSPSHKLVQALAVWKQAYNRVQAKQLELEIETRRKAGSNG